MYQAKILADSINQAGDRLTTMEITFPRLVLAEFNTHRMFSRNSASSRAIPVEKQLDRIENNPFIPTSVGKNRPGMQATEELPLDDQEQAVAIWLSARDAAVKHVRSLLELEVHKQIANRLLEPFMWHTVIVTATDWGNYWALRNNPMAQPEIHTVSELMQACYDNSQPQLVLEGQWHLPLIQPEERDGAFELSQEARMISAARCARVSYLTHDGKRDLEADLKLYRKLVDGGHMSPLEHVATPACHKLQLSPGKSIMQSGYRNGQPYIGNFRGWKQLRKFIRHEHDFSLVAKN